MNGAVHDMSQFYDSIRMGIVLIKQVDYLS